jgi:hypothetical protein
MLARRDASARANPIISLLRSCTMPFDSIVSRTDAAATIPQEVVADVVRAATAQSAALSLCRTVNMGSSLATLPVLSALARAFWVQGDTGLKQTTELA